MKRIFIFPTIEEAKAFILTEPRDPVFIGGVGTAEIAAATVKAVKAKKPHLVVLCGIAGAYDHTLQRGEVVEVVTERIAGLPERYAKEYETTGPDTGLPPAAGLTVNRTGDGVGPTAEAAGNLQYEISEADADGELNDDAIWSEEYGIEQHNDMLKSADPGGVLQEDALPVIENMEGAAFFAVCEALGVAGMQIRAISNYVGEPFGEWAVDEAVANLTRELTQIFANNE